MEALQQGRLARLVAAEQRRDPVDGDPAAVINVAEIQDAEFPQGQLALGPRWPRAPVGRLALRERPVHGRQCLEIHPFITRRCPFDLENRPDEFRAFNGAVLPRT